MEKGICFGGDLNDGIFLYPKSERVLIGKGEQKDKPLKLPCQASYIAHHPIISDRLSIYLQNPTIRKSLGCHPLESLETKKTKKTEKN